MAATPESSSASALSELFARAADCLSGSPAAPLPDDVARLLQSLEYASGPDTADLRANRTALLRAAAQFSRVFQLSAPDAPGRPVGMRKSTGHRHLLRIGRCGGA